jgi:hypothetical protein
MTVNKLIEHLNIRGINVEGVLRLAGSMEETMEIKNKLNSSQQPDL